MYVITVDDKIALDSSGNVISTREGTVIHATGSDNQQFLAITAGLTLEHNKSGSLSLTLPPTNYALRMGLLKKLKPIIRIYKDFVRHDNLVWKGRILDSSRDFIGRVTFRCEGWLSVLCDSIVFPTQGLEDNEKISKSPQKMFLELIASHNEQMGDNSGKQFNVHTYGFPGGDVDEVMAAATHSPLSVGSTGDEVTLLQTYLNKLGFTCAVDGIFGYETKNAVVAYQNSKEGLLVDGIVGDKTWLALDTDMSTETPYVASSVEFPNGSYETTLDYIEQNLIQNLEVGGSIWVEENDIYFYASGYEPYANQDIVFGENLLDFTEFIDASEVYTVLYPVGKDDLTLSGGFVEAPDAINLFGRIIRKEDFSDVENVEDLRTDATRMLADNIKANTSIEISAFDLAILDRDESAFKVGENVRVTSPPHNLDAYYLCTAINMDLCDPSKNTYTLGISPETLTDRLANAQNQITTTPGSSSGRTQPREGEFLGVDVSEHNGDIYWPAAVGVLDVAIIRVCTINRSTGNYDIVDPYFVQNYTGARANGINVGAYAYINGDTVADVRHEAEAVVGILQANNCVLNMPVWFDMEDEKFEYKPISTIKDMLNAFKEVVENAGYIFGIYTNKNWWNNIFPDDIKYHTPPYPFWIASFPNTEYDNGTIKESLRPGYGDGWQYSGYGMKTGRLNGFQNPNWMLDMDIFYTIWNPIS